MAKVAVITLARCWKCSAIHGQVVTLSCGHHFCLKCLDDQHDEFTEGCKQPCRACFRLTVPKKTDIRNLTVDMDIPALDSLILNQGNQHALTGGADDKLRPCKIVYKFTDMPSDRLREKAVLAGIEAVQKYDGYFERAKYVIKEKFDAEEEGGWCCFVRSRVIDDRLYAVSCSHYGSNKIWIRVGSCYFDLMKCKP